MPSRLVMAMMLYAALALVGTLVLDGKIRLFILIFFGALAFRTWVAHRAGW